jgi:hypothetical protein
MIPATLRVSRYGVKGGISYSLTSISGIRVHFDLSLAAGAFLPYQR